MKPYGPWMRASSRRLGHSADEKWFHLAPIGGKTVSEVILGEDRMIAAQVIIDKITSDKVTEVIMCKEQNFRNFSRNIDEISVTGGDQ